MAGEGEWIARIVTTCGPVEVLLDGSRAPAGVASFLELARSGYYDDSGSISIRSVTVQPR
ncbi:peptidylprolyl isomerase [Intrasporangium calvum]|uniref:peptidylprolyl isomerase n=1 Tax=Intrasporangium calvum TaxID=53358 RepID=UPI00031E1D3D|nr:peptidylprolyl isomerase [Intrasporangium calvum]